MTGPLVVVGKAILGPPARADGAGPRRDLDQLQPGEGGGVTGARHRAGAHGGELAGTGGGELRQAIQLSELDGLEHRLVVLLLVAHDELDDDPVADAPPLDDAERSLAHLLQVLAGLGRAQERQLAAAGARSLKCVIDIGQLLVQQRLAAEAMHDPEVLEGGDVAQVPHQWAHQG
jgi:hypothetical protein